MIVLDSLKEGGLDSSKASSMVKMDKIFVLLTLSNDDIECWMKHGACGRKHVQRGWGSVELLSGWQRDVPETIMMVSASCEDHMIILNSKEMMFSEEDITVIIT